MKIYATTGEDRENLYSQFPDREEGLNFLLEQALSREIGEEAKVEESFFSHRPISDRTPGSKSKPYRITTRFSRKREGRKSSTELQDYLLKQYILGSKDMAMKDDADLRFMTERAVMSVATDSIPPISFYDRRVEAEVFPRLSSYGIEGFDERRMLLMHINPDKNLTEYLAGIERDIVDPSEISFFLDPLVLLHDLLPHYKSVIEERLGQRMAERGPEDFSEHFLTYVQILSKIERERWSEEDTNTLKQGFLRLGKHLGPQPPQYPYQTIIQLDGYAFHNMGSSLVDAGSVVVSSRALNLGCLLTDPSVYFRLGRNAQERESSLLRLLDYYLLKRKQLTDTVKESHGIEIDKLEDSEKFKQNLLDGIYLGFYTNIKMAAGLFFYGNGDRDIVRSYLEPIEELLTHFKMEGYRIYATLERLGVMDAHQRYEEEKGGGNGLKDWFSPSGAVRLRRAVGDLVTRTGEIIGGRR